MLVHNIFPFKKGRIKKFFEGDLKALANLVNDTHFHTREGAIHNGAQGGLGNTAFLSESVLGHIPRVTQFGYSFGDGFV